jgi:hypothetical protein
MSHRRRNPLSQAMHDGARLMAPVLSVSAGSHGQTRSAELHAVDCSLVHAGS